MSSVETRHTKSESRRHNNERGTDATKSEKAEAIMRDYERDKKYFASKDEIMPNIEDREEAPQKEKKKTSKSRGVKSVANTSLAAIFIKKTSDETVFLSALDDAMRESDVESVLQILHKAKSLFISNLARDVTPLHVAVYLSCLSVVQFLLEQGLTPNALDRKHRTCFWYSGLKGSVSVARALITSNADPMIADEDGVLAVHIAARRNHIAFMEYLIHLDLPDIVAAVDGKGIQPAEYAVTFGYVDIIKMLFVGGGDPFTEGPPTHLKEENNLLEGEVGGVTLLHRAVCCGHFDVVKILLEHKVNLNARTHSLGLTAIHLALLGEHPNIAALLLDAGARANVISKKGLRPILLACQLGYVSLIRPLLRQGASLFEKDGEDNILMMSVVNGHQELTETLLAFDLDINSANRSGMTLLHMAIRRKDLKVVRMLLRRGASKFIVCKRGFNAYFYACGVGDSRIMQELLKDSAIGLNTIPPTKETVLHWAAFGGSKKCVMYALSTGELAVDALDGGFSTPLFWAAERDNKCLSFLLERGANPNHQNVELSTPLMWASEAGSVEAARALLIAGAKVGMVDAHGRSALHQAASTGSFEVVQLLLNHGANPADRDNAGYQSIHYAAFAGSISTCRILLDQGMPIDVTDNRGRTPLVLAVRAAHVNCALWLLQQGANLYLADNDGMSVMLHAAYLKRDEMYRVLVSFAQGLVPSSPVEDIVQPKPKRRNPFLDPSIDESEAQEEEEEKLQLPPISKRN